jgi:hypothetical protein
MSEELDLLHQTTVLTTAIETTTTATTTCPDAGRTTDEAPSARRKRLVAQLKARRGILLVGFCSSLNAITVILPLTCANMPRELCIEGNIYSNSPSPNQKIQ